MLHSKSIGSKIAEARKNIQLSQAELTKHISISPQAVGKWERGESMPDINTLNRLAELFGVDLNYFSESKGVMDLKDHVPANTTDNAVTKLKNNIGLNWDMGGSEWDGADFSGLKNLKDVLKGSSMKNCKFVCSEMSDINFIGNEIVRCDFSKADFRNSKFNGSEIAYNMFVGSSLIDAEFAASEISNCNFSNADFSGLEIISSEFRKNNIEDVCWKYVSLKETQLTDLVFNGVMENCSFDNCAFSRVTFKNVILKNCFFKNAKLKRLILVDCQADRLTMAFLKNCKADVSGVKMIEE
jgi:uncharacterized protein YjbI with pentapeptide repeats